MHAASLFSDTFEAHPDGIWSAPGRVNLIGEHTDYNDGLVLPFAIELRTEVALHRRDDRGIRAISTVDPACLLDTSIDELAPGRLEGWRAYAASTVWALGVECGFDIAIDSTVPPGAGLSSSAALLSALTLGQSDLTVGRMPPMEVARLAHAAENDFVGAPTGGMDQVVAMLGVADHAVLFDTMDQSTELVPLDPTAADLSFVVIDTGVRHDHGVGDYGDRRSECRAAAAALGVTSLRSATDASGIADPTLAARARHVISDSARVLTMAAALSEGDWDAVGLLMVEGHQSYRDDFEASCPEADLAVEALVGAGALGARLTGGGFGGSVIALCTTDDLPSNVAAVRNAYADAGLPPPSDRIVTPSDGARRDA